MFGDDVLARSRPAAAPPQAVPAVRGLWVEHRGTGFTGVVADAGRREVALRDDSGLLRVFPLDAGGFRLVSSGEVVTLTTAVATTAPAVRTTASGAVAAAPQPARTARADRILVEGIHDAELLEKVWGDELRPEGIVVEPIDGVDNLAAELRVRQPGPQRRFGVLLDHMVPGSKEHRVAQSVAGPFVQVEGHPYVDVWQAVRPHVLGLQAWPVVPRGQPWKEGVARALGADAPPAVWRRILRSVGSYRDLEPSFVGAVERLLDFLLSD